MQLIYWHGWGYDSTVFAPLLKILAEFDAICISEGYFGETSIPQTIHSEAIGIGHSQGFSRLVQTFPHLKGYVSLNGYTQFLQSHSFANGIPKAVLGAMIQQFQRHPDKVLESFYRNCGYLPDYSALKRNDELLRQNLTALRSLSVPRPRAPVLAIAAAEDQIVPLKLQQDCFTQIQIIDQANHSLIPQHALPCASLIRRFIESLPK